MFIQCLLDTNFTKRVPDFFLSLFTTWHHYLLVTSCVHSFEVFSEGAGARTQASRVLLVITDGVSNDATKLKSAVENAAKKNIIRYAIGVRSHYI